MPNFSVLYTNSGNRFKASEIRLTDEDPVRWPTGSFHFFIRKIFRAQNNQLKSAAIG